MNIVISIFMVMVLTLTGRSILRVSRLNGSFLETSVLSFGIGLGIWGYLVFILGLSYLLYKVYVWALLTVAFVFLLPALRAMAADARAWSKKALKTRPDKVSLFFIFIILAQLIMTFIFNLGPVIGWDAPNTYLYVGKAYAASHGLTHIPSHIFAAGPQLIELIFATGILLKDGILAALLNWWIGLFMVLAVYCIGRRFSSRRISLMAASIFISMPLFIYYAEEAKPTLGVHFFGILCAWLFIRYMENREFRYLLLSGLFGAFAMASSVLSLLPITGLACVYLVSSITKKRRPRTVIKELFLFFLIIFVVGSPFYIRSAILTGNPVFPYCYKFFGGANWNVELHNYLKRYYPAQDLNIFKIIKYVFYDYTISPAGSNIVDKAASPLFLIYIPLLIFIRRKPVFVSTVLVFTAIYFLGFYFSSAHMRRYSIVITPFLCVLSAYAISELNTKGKILKLANAASLILFIAFGMVVSGSYLRPRLPAAVGIQSSEDYLSKYYDFYDTLVYANKHTPASSKILLLWAHGYYCDRDCLRGDNHQGLIAYDFLKTPQELINRLKELKIDYVILNSNFRNSDLKEHKLPYAAMDMIKRRYLEPVYSKNNVDLYKIKYD